MNLVRISLILCICTLCGCGDGRPRCYPVEGTVLVDGAPLSGTFDGTIRLVSADPDSKYGRPATGRIDSNGRFTLTSFEDGDGCPKGRWKVELLVLETRGKKLFYRLPSRYQNAATSGLQVEITGKTTDLRIEAQWRPEDAPDRAPITGPDGAS